MKKHLYLYLFIFAALVALITYINGRKYQEELEEKITELRSLNSTSEAQLKDYRNAPAPAGAIFSLDQNPEAENYFYSRNMTVEKVQKLVKDALRARNLEKGGNNLIPYKGEGRGFAVNDMQLINNKWILANFFDGQRWGEVLLQYDINEDQTVDFTTIKAMLYATAGN
ncbi:MAG: hypothetical protein WBA16_07555 [Nonlabens sp.]